MKTMRLLLSTVLVATMLSGCIVPFWWDDGPGYGHHGGYHHGYGRGYGHHW